jgi:hypothetical protein
MGGRVHWNDRQVILSRSTSEYPGSENDNKPVISAGCKGVTFVRTFPRIFRKPGNINNITHETTRAHVTGPTGSLSCYLQNGLGMLQKVGNYMAK